MTTLRHLLEANQIGLSVYSPDCTQARLWGHLDHAIHHASGLQPIYRQWFHHDYNSIMRFYHSDEGEPVQAEDVEAAAKKYDAVAPENLQYGHLVVKLLLSGASLLTLWQGANAIETLLKIKGATHPSQAEKGSIRGSFWCDNSVCNLTHTSDTIIEVVRELAALNLSSVLDAKNHDVLPLMPITPAPQYYVAHCALSVICDVLQRVYITDHHSLLDVPRLPASGDAHETNALLAAFLRNSQAQIPTSQLAKFIEAYFAGDVIGTTRMMYQLPMTKWEQFVVQCGVITRDKWTD